LKNAKGEKKEMRRRRRRRWRRDTGTRIFISQL
jgi:hypothetical protein